VAASEIGAILNMENIFFTADHHFGHRGIIEYASRPFSNPEEMDEHLIEQWNAVVGKNDRVYHLGDVSFRKPDATHEILSRLHGIKYLVKGNHDRINRMVEDHWLWVKDYHELRIGSQKIILCHYPFDTWNKAHYGSWHLHGHSHGSLTSTRGGRLDIGVDKEWETKHQRFVPWHFDEIAEYMANFDYNLYPVDHHRRRRG
jgi:calcineurin-like phosphoesterase family protein